MGETMLIAYGAIGIMATSVAYYGCLNSLKKIKKDKNQPTSSSDSESDSESETESIATEDAYMFPIYGSGALFSLYLLFKYFNEAYINYLISAYIALAGLFSLTKLLSLIFKGFITNKLKPFRFRFQHGEEEIYKLKFDYINIGSFIISILITVYYLLTKNWIANNLFGIAFSMSAIQLIQIDSFKTGIILLAGLFIYDIFWVFGTVVMVSVATKVDAPIKLLWPKSLAPLTTGGQLQFTLLGLGDIVMPGVFIALCLAFDRHLAIEAAKAQPNANPMILKKLQRTPKLADYPKPYFQAGLLAYILGLGTTIFVMHTFKAAQPALLYLSPACIAAPLIVAASKGQLKQLFEFDNSDEKKEENKKKEDGDEKEIDAKPVKDSDNEKVRRRNV